MTVKDREIQDRVDQFQRDGVPVRVSRFIGVDASDADEAEDPTKSEERTS
jgi:hypothetical protein